MKARDYDTKTIKNLFGLEGKNAIITGGGGSLGFAMAKGLAAYGANIVLTGRTRETLDAAAAKLAEFGVKTLVVTGDSQKEADCEKVVGETAKAFGSVDILITAAGVARRFPAEEFPAEKFDEVIDTNIKGVFLINKATGRQMIRQGSGKVINISSVRANNGHPLGYAAYASSKGAINALTRQLSSEWAKYGINVNCIAPTVVVTPLTKEVFDDPEKSRIFTDRIPFGRAAVAEELIGTTVYLASPASDFITGQIIYVDGGCVAG
ncbi:MAG: SDR family oxidoreductase [Clostridiales Family XIII bacterium]|jgi:gluconate 5-dehydrogenase|nr:SDR family oxidoreductase [Clostridiales Family XIII bacterium]